MLDESIFSLLIGPPKEVTNIPAQISARGHRASLFFEMNSSDLISTTYQAPPQPKYQLSVIGRVHRQRLTSRGHQHSSPNISSRSSDESIFRNELVRPHIIRSNSYFCPVVRVFWSQKPIYRTNQVVTGSAYVSKMVAENSLILSDVDLMRCLSDI